MENAESKRAMSKREAFGFLIPLLFLSVFLASAVISIANDMYAFVKPTQEINITLDSEISDKELSAILRENKVIKNDLIFTLYLHSKKKSDLVPALRGEFTLNSNMSYREILLNLF